MSKKNLIIISLMLSIFGLIYMIISYTGIFRRFMLRKINVGNYLSKYPDLPFGKGKNRVVVCFNSPLKDFAKLEPFLNSILDQTIRVNDIVMAIPYKEIGSVPESYKKVLTIHGYMKDYENVANIICSILREPEANTKIILVDSGVLYGKDFLQIMVEKSEENPDKIIYGKKDKNLSGGILYKPKFFDEKVVDYKSEGHQDESCHDWIEKCSKNGETFIDYDDLVKI